MAGLVHHTAIGFCFRKRRLICLWRQLSQEGSYILSSSKEMTRRGQLDMEGSLHVLSMHIFVQGGEKICSPKKSS